MARPTTPLRITYEKAADAYLRSLPPEHFMEATPQATQRKITLESMDVVHVHRPDIQCFNELLVQYPFGDDQRIHQVVPDNMAVKHDEPIKAVGSFDLPFQPVGPFWVLEYVSKSSERKDYEGSFSKYERELKVPYYLAFYPDIQDLTLYHLSRQRYVSVKPNPAGRYPIPELELELALLEGWVRFWFRGQLVPLPDELQRSLDETRRQLRQARRELQKNVQLLQQKDLQLQQMQALADRERQEKERILARLRELGVEPPE